jgi:hypothetical protein
MVTRLRFEQSASGKYRSGGKVLYLYFTIGRSQRGIYTHEDCYLS